MDRRTFLKKSGVLALSVSWAPGCGSEATDEPMVASYNYTGPMGPADVFTHGVASGDPFDTSVVLWTRAKPDVVGDEPIFWEVALDPDFELRVSAGQEALDPERDGAFKVIADGLSAGQTYYYRFWVRGRSSVIGRTRTSGPVDHVRLAVCSCSNYATGLFVGYRGIARRRDLDAVIHLGDYIYEKQYGPANRPNQPPYEVVTLADYRTRYGHYRTDPDLLEAHRQHPFICVWDDHESANNSYKDGAQNHDPEDGEGSWQDRRQAATRAWTEWLPVREAADGRIWRRHAWGNLLDLFMLDTRLWARAKQVSGGMKEQIADPERPFLGQDQEKWLHEGLVQGSGRWKVLGQQVMIAQLKVNGTALNTDQWDGYEATRDRLFDVIEDQNIEGFVVLTGDIHTSWASDLTRDSSDPERYNPTTGQGAMGVEFVAPGITAGGFGGGSVVLGELARDLNPHIRWVDLVHRGYFVLDVRDSAVQSDWFHYATLQDDAEEKLGASWLSVYGSGHLTEADSSAAEKDQQPDLAPG